MNGVDFPSPSSLTGSRPRARRGWRRQDQTWSGVASTRRPSCRWRDGPATGADPPLHRVHGCRHHERVAGRRRGASEEILGLIDAEAPGAGRRELPGRGLRPLPLPGRVRRGGGDRLRHAAVLRRLYAGPALGRRAPLHLPVRDPGYGPERAVAGRRVRYRARGPDPCGVGYLGGPLLGAPQRRKRVLPKVEMFALAADPDRAARTARPLLGRFRPATRRMGRPSIKSPRTTFQQDRRPRARCDTPGE